MVVNRPKKDTPFSIGDSNNDCADFVQGWHTTAAWVASAQTTKSQADRIVLFPNSDSSVRAGSDRNASIEHTEPNDGTTTGKQRSRWLSCNGAAIFSCSSWPESYPQTVTLELARLR
jgi:hypothetical protein